ncbi:hypothetical protein E2C01_067028 [Portunus trituberculatus]|uniref:Uncharacterized protein n=1 Tax=Portunus trituberculatus TaxID=210409 RepID=A0A5B7HSJ0_PORTR|nr:hypothetical protein [Portunus trituberculatus]
MGGGGCLGCGAGTAEDTWGRLAGGVGEMGHMLHQRERDGRHAPQGPPARTREERGGVGAAAGGAAPAAAGAGLVVGRPRQEGAGASPLTAAAARHDFVRGARYAHAARRGRVVNTTWGRVGPRPLASRRPSWASARLHPRLAPRSHAAGP